MTETLLIVYLLSLIFLFWAAIWSLCSVLIHRWITWEGWEIFWRSHCPKCNHKLWIADLVPVLSYLALRWKCRYCKISIPKFYFFLEVWFWTLFVSFAYLFFITSSYLVLFAFNLSFVALYAAFRTYYLKTFKC